MNKLAVIVPTYLRPNITNLCLSRLAKQSIMFGFDLIIAGSDENRYSNYGYYFWTKNLPLGKKHNTLLKSTLQLKKYDGVILIGSDDFVSDSVFEHYLTADMSEKAMYYFEGIYFYDTKSKRKGYLDKAITGVGRCFTRPLLEQLNYTLWSENKNKGLDRDSLNRIKKTGALLIKNDINHFILDVKTGLNISKNIFKFAEKTDADFSVIDEFEEIKKM